MTIGPATVVIIAEHKEPLPATVVDGITLFTTHVRRAAPDTLDPKLNSHSKLNDITACIQAYTAGADEALMLDPHGFVATCNSTHFFIVVGAEDAPEVLDLGRALLPRRDHARRTCSRSAVPTASPRARRRSASPTSTPPARRSSPERSPASYRSAPSTGERSASGRRGPIVERLQDALPRARRSDVASRVAP